MLRYTLYFDLCNYILLTFCDLVCIERKIVYWEAVDKIAVDMLEGYYDNLRDSLMKVFSLIISAFTDMVHRELYSRIS